MGFLGGGFFGSGAKSSSSASTQQTTSTVTNIDAAQNDGGINDITSIGSMTGGSIAISKTDYGAIDAASSIADKALASVDRVVDSSLASVKASQSTLADIAADAQSTARAAAESDATESIKYLIIGLAVVGVFWALASAKAFK